MAATYGSGKAAFGVVAVNVGASTCRAVGGTGVPTDDVPSAFLCRTTGSFQKKEGKKNRQQHLSACKFKQERSKIKLEKQDQDRLEKKKENSFRPKPNINFFYTNFLTCLFFLYFSPSC